MISLPYEKKLEMQLIAKNNNFKVLPLLNLTFVVVEIAAVRNKPPKPLCRSWHVTAVCRFNYLENALCTMQVKKLYQQVEMCLGEA